MIFLIIALNAFEVILLITIYQPGNPMNMKVPICVIFLSIELFEIFSLKNWLNIHYLMDLLAKQYWFNYNGVLVCFKSSHFTEITLVCFSHKNFMQRNLTRYALFSVDTKFLFKIKFNSFKYWWSDSKIRKSFLQIQMTISKYSKDIYENNLNRTLRSVWSRVWMQKWWPWKMNYFT